MENIFILFSANEDKEWSSMKIIQATTDREVLLDRICKELKNSHIEYMGLSGEKAVENFRADSKNNNFDFDNLGYAYVDVRQNEFERHFDNPKERFPYGLKKYIETVTSWGEFNSYVSDILLDNLDKVAECAVDTHEGIFFNIKDFKNACEKYLQTQNMDSNYNGYGKRTYPLTCDEALLKFDKGETVYAINKGESEKAIANREDIEKNDIFYASKIGLNGEKLLDELKHEELKRSLERVGYDVTEKICGKASISKNGNEILLIAGDEMFYHKAYEMEAFMIFKVRNEINEYVTAYQNAIDNKAKSNQGYQLALDWNNIVLGIKQSENGDFKFVTWNKDRQGNGYSNGHYFEGYVSAKEDFAKRSELINSNVLFSEKELNVIRSNLSEYITIDDGANVKSFEQEKSVQIVLEKIDNLIAPTIDEQQKQDEQEQGDEMEFD